MQACMCKSSVQVCVSMVYVCAHWSPLSVFMCMCHGGQCVSILCVLWFKAVAVALSGYDHPNTPDSSTVECGEDEKWMASFSIAAGETHQKDAVK